MLVAALELARAVREQSGVAWNDPQRVDAYTARLRELVSIISQIFIKKKTKLGGGGELIRG